MSEDFESQLHRRMNASARALPYKADRSQVVKRRGQRRRLVSQGATALGALLVVFGGFAVANAVLDQPDNTTQVLADGQDSGGEDAPETDTGEVDNPAEDGSTEDGTSDDDAATVTTVAPDEGDNPGDDVVTVTPNEPNGAVGVLSLIHI